MPSTSKFLCTPEATLLQKESRRSSLTRHPGTRGVIFLLLYSYSPVMVSWLHNVEHSFLSHPPPATRPDSNTLQDAPHPKRDTSHDIGLEFANRKAQYSVKKRIFARLRVRMCRAQGSSVGASDCLHRRHCSSHRNINDTLP